ncbi:Cof-type HAD-IIB family hydrolase [Streptococcus loxodontisalivarius]|uniref:Cof subfamily protein (Haloacid dehalogenase superfamily) n=1 Tax=Streptococcus loxodontisalivarius TaxID=1349415 RepID=A0ABS2PQD3_9STRE|nr:Cof-type HAD-IIB family hydrolase [Streptococcus loxodontisalivarius]MBM7642253.1 Cof subfamily protein (haloacid dehalogenase superfamily) [Streptococcus loxodontisalivarius]
MIKLIAIDMDGTLLNSQKEIPEENILAIQKAAAAGVKIVLCTGRPKSGILPYFEKLGLTEEEYIIMNNGCTIYNTKDWDLIHYESLTSQEIAQLQAACQDVEGVSLTLTGEKTYYEVADKVSDLVAYDAGLVFDTAQARSLEAIDQEGEIIFQAMYMGEKEFLDPFEQSVDGELSQVFSTVRSQSYIYEAMPKGATKASALKVLAQHLGLTEDNIMAMGDAANDLEMLTYAKHSVAMGNASADIKSLCRYTTTTNDQAGVAQAIYDYVL